MTPSYPFYRPFEDRYRRSRYGYYSPYTRPIPPPFSNPSPNPVIEETCEKEKEEEKREDSSPEIFEIFGISLHFDDILLLCLLFFLYLEGVDDQWLFISLIMLLLS